MLVVAVVAILVVGPKDLPKMLRGFGRTMKSIRGLAGDFQKQFDEAVKEADLEDVKNIATGKGFKPLEDIKSSTEAFKKEVKASMSAAEKSVKDGLPNDKIPEPAIKESAKVDTKPAVKPVAETKATLEPVAKKAAAKPVPKKATAKKAQAKKIPAKKAASATGKS